MPDEELRTPEQKKRDLYVHQKDILDKFLERGAISKREYSKSLNDMTLKMGYSVNNNGN